MTVRKSFDLQDIMAILPHRPPFLFVDRVIKVIPDRWIVAERELRPDEPQFAGHFPGKPIMPGVLVTDALAQTSGLLWGFSKIINNNGVFEKSEFFYLAAVSMKYTHSAEPGETLRLFSEIDRIFDRLYSYNVEATCGRRRIAKGMLTLALKEGNS
jgi:3-hydroxyacyl-[acyl-carrier-protein] dehydratase